MTIQSANALPPRHGFRPVAVDILPPPTEVMSVAEIRMSVRVRPLVSGSLEPPAVRTDPRSGALSVPLTGDVFDYPSSVVVGSCQQVAYDALCAPLVAHAMRGHECTLVAYGQTGSGKTHTMFGPPGCLVENAVRRWEESKNNTTAPCDWGLFPRSVLCLMDTKRCGVRSIYATAIEVYHENVFDLMNGREQLSVGSSKTKFGRRVAGACESGSDDVAARGGAGGVHPSCCTCMRCFKLQEITKGLAKADRAARRAGVSKPSIPRVTSNSISGNKNDVRETFSAVGAKTTLLDSPYALARFARSVEATRTQKSHLLNDRSSRSHCLVKISAKGADGKSISLLFVDLAGSERVSRTGAVGDAKQEAQAINGSLSALGRVVKALGEAGSGGAKNHIPYRDASLTMLLRDSFGGGSCTSVVINVANENAHVDETVCSLRFGERMAVVRNTPSTLVIGRESSSGGDTSKINLLRRELEIKKQQLQVLHIRGDGGGFLVGGPVTEIQSLKDGLRKLELADTEVDKLRIALSEAKGARDPSATRVISIQKSLAAATSKAETLRAVVQRQQTIKAIWRYPTAGFTRKLQEVRELEQELEMEEA